MNKWLINGYQYQYFASCIYIHDLETFWEKYDITNMEYKANFNPRMNGFIDFIKVKSRKEMKDIFMKCMYDNLLLNNWLFLLYYFVNIHLF